ncbi:hypothetical protein MTR67_004252 [Solanum verrucosum]|uniref:NERD domain-containing protein n=1 Tax=Solanum verrucosum TaxID=315347 RepID=A0AAF0T7M1_SOLVR|nr:hypothetical protein MTR67_004252 [Solanum verrucosum]
MPISLLLFIVFVPCGILMNLQGQHKQLAYSHAGVKKVMSASDAAFEIHLQLSNLMKDIPISSLSDDNFYEEECEDLRERIKAGLLKRPTVLELESKAQVLHKDITKHWIEREVVLLQKHIDHANEKGWRKQYPFICLKVLLLKYLHLLVVARQNLLFNAAISIPA